MHNIVDGYVDVDRDGMLLGTRAHIHTLTHTLTHTYTHTFAASQRLAFEWPLADRMSKGTCSKAIHALFGRG